MPPVWAMTGARPAVCSMTTSNRWSRSSSVEGDEFSGAAAGDEGVDAGVKVAVDDLPQQVVIDLAALVERGGQGGEDASD